MMRKTTGFAVQLALFCTENEEMFAAKGLFRVFIKHNIVIFGTHGLLKRTFSLKFQSAENHDICMASRC